MVVTRGMISYLIGVINWMNLHCLQIMYKQIFQNQYECDNLNCFFFIEAILKHPIFSFRMIVQ